MSVQRYGINPITLQTSGLRLWSIQHQQTGVQTQFAVRQTVRDRSQFAQIFSPAPWECSMPRLACSLRRIWTSQSRTLVPVNKASGPIIVPIRGIR